MSRYRSISKNAGFALLLLLLSSWNASAQVTPACNLTPVLAADGTTLTATDIANQLVDPAGITIVSVSYSGAPGAVGTFTNGSCVGARSVNGSGQGNGIDRGLIISTGNARNLMDRTQAVIGMEALPAGVEPPLPQGTSIRNPDGQVLFLKGTVAVGSDLNLPNGSGVPLPFGTSVSPAGTVVLPNGQVVLAPGSFALAAGTTILAGGIYDPDPFVVGDEDVLPAGIVLPLGVLAVDTLGIPSGSSLTYFTNAAHTTTSTVNFPNSAPTPAGSLVRGNGSLLLANGKIAMEYVSVVPFLAGVAVATDGSATLSGSPFVLPLNYDDYFAEIRATQESLISTPNGTPGDPDLDVLIGAATLDSASLSIEFKASKPWVAMKYVFASDEYNEFANKPYNDSFAFFLNGRNVALLPNSQIPVSINSVNVGRPGDPSDAQGPQNPRFFIDNSGRTRAAIEMDGTTIVMTVASLLSDPAFGDPPFDPNAVYSMKMSIGDVSDSYGDSQIIIKYQSLRSIDTPFGDPSYDEDLDGVLDMLDNCQSVPNPDQAYTPTFGNSDGDACRDRDNDGILDVVDLCPLFADPTNLCGNASPAPPPVMNFFELNTRGQSCVAGPWATTTTPNPNGPATFSFSVTRTAADPRNLKVNLSYADPGRVGGQPYAISINNATTSAFQPFDNPPYGPGVQLAAPCSVNNTNATCFMTAVDNDNGSLTKPPLTPPDRFQVRVSTGAFGGYSSGANLNVACGDIQAILFQRPTPQDDNFTVAKNTVLNANVITNDSDPANLPLTVVFNTNPSHGTLVILSNGTFTYTPAANYSGPDSFTYRVSNGLVESFNVTVNITVTAPADTTKPMCTLTAMIAGPPKKIQVTAQDTGSGLKTIVVTTATNLTTSIPAFIQGATAPVVVTATKVNQALPSVLALRVTDVAGNVTDCDPVLHTLIRDTGKPDPVSFTVPYEEHFIKISNGTPGVRKISIWVNGTKFNDAAGLKDGEVRVIDLRSAMKAGANVITLDANGGKKDGTADILIYDN